MMLCCDALEGGSQITDFIPFIELLEAGNHYIRTTFECLKPLEKLPSSHILRRNLQYGIHFRSFPFVILRRADLPKKLKLALYEVATTEMISLSLGEMYISQGDWSEKEYFRMQEHQSAVARIAAQFGGLFGNASKRQLKAFRAFAEALHIAFALREEIFNMTLVDQEYFGGDIACARRTLLMTRTLAVALERDRKKLLEILSSRTRDRRKITEAVGILRQYDAFRYVREISHSLVDKAWRKLSPLLSDSPSKKKLEWFLDFFKI